MQIKYSEIANSSFLEILEFPEKNWTPKEINIFLDDVEIVLKSLVEGKIKQYQKSQSKTRSALIGKKTSECFSEKKMKTQSKSYCFSTFAKILKKYSTF